MGLAVLFWGGRGGEGVVGEGVRGGFGGTSARVRLFNFN